jgi:octaprenyl-diphosphate synthase
MQGVLELPRELTGVGEEIAGLLSRVAARFDRELSSELPPVADLTRHVERYRGKMLRPTLVMLGGLACGGGAGEGHVTVGVVCEMVHMATLVHDDVLDDATTRRRGLTVNRLHGNEAAVMLGDYLLATAYHLCSTLSRPRHALTVARASAVMCAGELLQLHHREDFSLDEETYFEIVRRKTGELISASCELGAVESGASEEVCTALREFGAGLGVAFQIQDDILDLTGTEGVVGKSVGKDLEKGKLTLPVIHHLATVPPKDRGRALRLLADACGGAIEAAPRAAAASELVRELARSGAIDAAAGRARELVQGAKSRLGTLPRTPARDVLELMADAVVDRAY